jgi:hypothetical protein
VFDVQPPHMSIHGWRDFSIHLATITIGLLIALGLEGCVEWLHHRHLMHQAQMGLMTEIKANADSVQAKIAALESHQQELKRDIEILKQIIASPSAPIHDTLTLRFDISGFDNVSWATAQSTGAVTYMSYAVAREYSDIYSEQAEIDAEARLAARDLSVAFGPLLNLKSGDASISAEDAKLMKQHVETLQGQLYLLDSLLHSVSDSYKKFLQTHPRPY